MITRYVNTASTAGGDGTTNDTAGATRAFASLLEAINSLPATLTDVTRIYCTGSAADTSAVNQSPWDMTTSDANYIEIIGEQSPLHFSASPSGKWDTGKYRIEVTNSNGIYSNVAAHVRIDGVQVQVTVNNGSGYVGFKTTNVNQVAANVDMRLNRCLVRGVRTSGNVTGFTASPVDAGTSGISRVWNCVAWDCQTGYSNLLVGGRYFNCTSYVCTYGYVADATMLCRNCLGASSSGFDFVAGAPFDAASSHNASSDTTAPGSASRTSQTFTFLDAANGDLHLAATDAGARDYGVADPETGLFSDDLDGQTRTGTWDIGADEYVATGGGVLVGGRLVGSALIGGRLAH